MSQRLPPYALWLDLETSGTQDTDKIIEIGIILTACTPGFEELAKFSTAILVGDVSEMPMSDEARRMHARNGLLEALERCEGMAIDEAENAILDMLEHYTMGDRIVLAGSGVAHFDRKFLAREMPDLDKRLVYYALDIGTTRRLARLAGKSVAPDNDKPHRALADARLALGEGRMYVKWLEKVTL